MRIASKILYSVGRDDAGICLTVYEDGAASSIDLSFAAARRLSKLLNPRPRQSSFRSPRLRPFSVSS